MLTRLKNVLPLLLCLGLAFAFAAHCRADSAEDNTATYTGQLVSGFTSWVCQAMLQAFTCCIFVLWLILTWAVIKLYESIGYYILPIWDFTLPHWSGPASPTTFLGRSVPDFMCVDPTVSGYMGAASVILFSIAVVLTFFVVSMDLMRSAIGGEDGRRIFFGFAAAFGSMLVFPTIYTGSILLCNDLTQSVQSWAQNTVPMDASQVFSVLTQFSFFGSMDAQTQASIGVGTAGQDVAPLVSSIVPATSVVGVGSVSNLSSPVTNPNTVTGMAAPGIPSNGTIDLSGEFSNVFSASGSCWNEAAKFVNSSIEVFFSRIIQIVLALMAIIELLMILLMKGAQIAGIVLNFFVGILACAFVASPYTRRFFFQWYRQFISLCLWGVMWQLLFLTAWIMLLAFPSLNAFTNVNIGRFLLPFIFYGTLKKFTDVASLVSGFGATGELARNVGSALHAGFVAHSPTAASAIEKGASAAAKAVKHDGPKIAAAANLLPGWGKVVAAGVSAGTAISVKVSEAQAMGSRSANLVSRVASGKDLAEVLRQNKKNKSEDASIRNPMTPGPGASNGTKKPSRAGPIGSAGGSMPNSPN